MRYVWLITLFTLLSWSSELALPGHFNATFEQTITNPKGKVISYKGSLIYGGASRMKWSYRLPTQKEVCTDGKELIIVDHDLEQISFYKVSKGFELERILKEAKPYKKNIYTASYGGKTYTIRLNQRGDIDSIAYFDDLDNKVQILFKNIKSGKGVLPAGRTKCHYPSGYDIIRG